MDEKISINKIKWINSLRQKKTRKDSDFFIVEGDKMAAELMDLWSNYIELIITTKKDFTSTNSYYIVNDVEMKKMSSLKTPNSFLIIAKKPKLDFPEKGLFLLLDEIQDPGNMGTIIRTADWFNVQGIICSTGSVDTFNSKVIQSSMGSLFRIPIKFQDFSELLPTIDQPIYGALLEGDSVYDHDICEESLYLMMGNEGNGVSLNNRKYISKKVKIPQFGKAESLNVAIATGILLSEFRRS